MSNNKIHDFVPSFDETCEVCGHMPTDDSHTPADRTQPTEAQDVILFADLLAMKLAMALTDGLYAKGACTAFNVSGVRALMAETIRPIVTAELAALKASHVDERERTIRHYDEVIERDGVKLASQQAEIEAARYWLWMYHPPLNTAHNQYGDDGEMQCCHLDFKRASMGFLVEAFTSQQEFNYHVCKAAEAAHLAELAKVRLEQQNEVTDLRKALRRVIHEHSELLATIKEQANLEANLFEARQALLTVGQEVIKQKEMLIWAFQHAQLGDEATSGQQEDFSDMHDKCRDYLYPDAQPKESASLKQQLDTCEALRIWQATELAPAMLQAEKNSEDN